MPLRYLAGGSYFDICRLHGVPKSSFWTVVDRAVDAIVEKMSYLCELPLDDEDKLKDLAAG